MKLWVARDKNGELWLFENKPLRGFDTWLNPDGDDVQCMMINPKHFLSITWESEPLLVKVTEFKEV